MSHLNKNNRPISCFLSLPDDDDVGEDVVVSARRIPVQEPRGTSDTLVTSSGLMVPLMSMGSGWMFFRSSTMTPSSTRTPSVFPFPLKVSQSLQKASGLAASEMLSQLSRTLWSSVSSQPEK